MDGTRKFFIITLLLFLWVSVPGAQSVQAVNLEDLIIAQPKERLVDSAKSPAAAPNLAGGVMAEQPLQLAQAAGTTTPPSPPPSQPPEKPAAPKPVSPQPTTPGAVPAPAPPAQPKPQPASPQPEKPPVPQPAPPPAKPPEPTVHRAPHPVPVPEKPPVHKPVPQPKPPESKPSGRTPEPMNPAIIAAIISTVGAIIVALISLLTRKK